MHTEINTNNVGGEYAGIYTMYRRIQNAIRDNSILTIGRGKEFSKFHVSFSSKEKGCIPFPVLKKEKERLKIQNTTI